MKKRFLNFTLILFTPLLILSSCISDVGNTTTYTNVLATVITRSNSKCLVQVDFDGGYYYADEFLSHPSNSTELLNEGDRILMNQTTLKYDEQPSLAYGTKDHPFKMTSVDFDLITKNNPIYNEDLDVAAKDSVAIVYTPQVIRTSVNNGLNYITFSIGSYKNAIANYRLVALETVEDTLCFDLRTNFKETPNNSLIEYEMVSFTLPEMASEQPIKVTHYGKNYDRNSLYKKDSRTYVINAPKIN